MQKIVPFLWFDGKAEEAARYYTSIFKNAKIVTVNKLITHFNLDGVEFTALNGGPQFHFTPAVSFLIRCETQEEVDHFWNGLSAGGETMECGWLRDRYGLTWQVTPNVLMELLQDPDKEKADRVFAARCKMEKLEIAGILEAAEGTGPPASQPHPLPPSKW